MTSPNASASISDSNTSKTTTDVPLSDQMASLGTTGVGQKREGKGLGVAF